MNATTNLSECADLVLQNPIARPIIMFALMVIPAVVALLYYSGSLSETPAKMAADIILREWVKAVVESRVQVSIDRAQAAGKVKPTAVGTRLASLEATVSDLESDSKYLEQRLCRLED